MNSEHCSPWWSLKHHNFKVTDLTMISNCKYVSTTKRCHYGSLAVLCSILGTTLYFLLMHKTRLSTIKWRKVQSCSGSPPIMYYYTIIPQPRFLYVCATLSFVFPLPRHLWRPGIDNTICQLALFWLENSCRMTHHFRYLVWLWEVLAMVVWWSGTKAQYPRTSDYGMSQVWAHAGHGSSCRW